MTDPIACNLIYRLAHALDAAPFVDDEFGTNEHLINQACAYLAQPPEPTRAEIEAAAVEEAWNSLTFVCPSNMKFVRSIFGKSQALTKQALFAWAARRRAGGVE